MISAIVYTIVICALLALAYWAVDKLGTPEPVNRVVKVGAVVVAIVVLLIVWLGVFGMAPVDAPALN